MIRRRRVTRVMIGSVTGVPPPGLGARFPATSPYSGAVLPFVLLAHRAEDAAADDEYAAVLRLGGLAPGQLRRVRLEQGPIGDLDPTAYSAVILGGGPYLASDPDERKTDTQRRAEADILGLLDTVVSQDLPFLGLCYGIGMLGTHQGGLVDRTFGEDVGRLSVTVTGAGAQDPLFEGLPETFEAFGGHKEALSTVPRTAVVLATSQACPVQAFRVGSNVYATQFHPEMDSASLQTRIDAYRDFGYFAPEEAESLKAVARERETPYSAEILRLFVVQYSR